MVFSAHHKPFTLKMNDTFAELFYPLNVQPYFSKVDKRLGDSFANALKVIHTTSQMSGLTSVSVFIFATF